MAGALSHPFLRHIRHLIGDEPAAALTDGQLLERFLAHRDETAVEALLRRYGPLVLGVCRRVLRNSHAAEDAFQATFLVLLRKAPALDRGKPLGSWLYTVAYRLALGARAQELRRQRREARAAQSRPQAEDNATSPSDLIVALEEELHRLPPGQRDALVLCYLEGKTNEQAAAILGCPRGSMAARLARAKERLRSCLARRGHAVPGAAIATLLAGAAAEAAVPLPLLDNTVRAAVWFAGKQAATTGAVSAQALALARGAFRAMVVNKLKIAAALLLATAMLGTGATLLLTAAPQANPPEQAAEPPAPDAPPDRAEIAGEPLPGGSLARMGTTRLRHGDAASFAAYTPGGKALVTAGKDRTVRLWDLTTGNEIRRFPWGPVRPESAEDGIAQRWEQQVWEVMARTTPVALSADGRVVAASRGGIVCLWQTATGKELRQLQTGQKRLVQLAFSADGHSLLTLGPGQAVAFWEVATGKCLRRIDGKPAAGAPAHFLDTMEQQIAVVSPAWKYLAWQHLDPEGTDGTTASIRVRDLATGRESPPIKTANGALALAFSPDDKTLAWAQIGGRLAVSDVATGRERHRLGGAGPDVTAIAFSADGRRLAVSRRDHTVELWDPASGKLTGQVAKAAKAPLVENYWSSMARPALAFSPDGTKVVCSLGGAALRQFRADTGAEIPPPHNGHRAPVSSLALSADGKSLWTFGPGDPVRRWDWHTGRQTGQRQVPAGATRAVFAADGQLAVAEGAAVTLCGSDGKNTGQLITGKLPLVALALSPDGTLLATRSLQNPEVRLWDTRTGKERHTLGHVGDGRAGMRSVLADPTGVLTPDLVFSADGRCLAGAGPTRQLCVWDAATGNLLWELAPQAGRGIERFVFSPSGQCLAAVHADGGVTLYEAASGHQRGQLRDGDPNTSRVDKTVSRDGTSFPDGGWRAAAVCLAFSPDGRYLAVTQETPDIHLWDVRAGREVDRLRGHEGGVVSLLFAPDGKHLFSGGTDTTALTWDLSQPRPTPADKLPPKALESLWTDLAGKDATRAFAALRRLSVCPDQSAALIRERVRPAAPPDVQRLATLLAELENDRFEVRRRAEVDLEGLGDLAEMALCRALADEPPPDLRQRLERLRDKLAVPTPDLLRELRAVELLELLGTAEARQVLQTLAGGVPTARLTHAAANAVQRLGGQTAGP
jgi:RNA polymerase sigma factor (sigma-70 family)